MRQSQCHNCKPNHYCCQRCESVTQIRIPSHCVLSLDVFYSITVCKLHTLLRWWWQNIHINWYVSCVCVCCTCLSMPGGQQWKNPHQNQYSFDLDLVHFIFRINWRLSGMHDWFTADWTYTYDHVTWFVTTSKSSDPLTSVHTSFNFHFTSHIQLQSTDIYCRLVWLPDGCSIDKRHQWSANP